MHSIRVFRILTWCILIVQSTHGHAAELLVKWKPGAIKDEKGLTSRARIGAKVIRSFESLGWELLELPLGMSTAEGIRLYSDLDSVIAVERNARLDTIRSDEDPAFNEAGSALRAAVAARTPNDPRYSEQWNLKKINAPAAWEVSTGSNDVIVAILDTGVDYSHPDLAANMWRNPGETGLDSMGRDKAANGMDDDNNGYIDDVHGVDTVRKTGHPMDSGDFHGTRIAGVIGAVGHNAVGITGINWSVRIMAIKPWGYLADLIAGWDYVVMMKRRGVNIRVTNNSYGYPAYSIAWRDAVAAAGEAGILNVVGAGNFRLNEDRFSYSPGIINLSSIINVTASNAADTLNDDADFGRSTVHLAAPGDSILSTAGNATYVTSKGGSHACPHVAGAAALLLAINPHLRVDQLKAALFGSVDQPVSLRGKVFTNGRLNIGRAVQYLSETNPPAIVINALPAGIRAGADFPIHVTFNKPMDSSSVENAFEVSPALPGGFWWNAEKTEFFYHHDVLFDPEVTYTVKIRGTARDLKGESLDGNFNRVFEGSPADDFSWSFSFPPTNDDFVRARVIGGAQGQVDGTTQYTSWEWGEPSNDRAGYSASVWYRWIAPERGWFTFDLTSNSTFDSLLNHYTGSDVAALRSVIGNDNYGSKRSSRLSFEANAGVTYFIAVAGFNARNPVEAGNEGPFTLAWYPTPPPGFTGTQFSPSSGGGGTRVTLTGTNFTGATAVLFNGVTATFTNAPGNNVDLRITAIVPPNAISGPVTILTPHGNVTSAASFEVIRPTLTIIRNSATEFTLSWAGTTFALESSSDLRSWTHVAPPGATEATLNSGSKQAFFRLRAQ